MKTEKSQMHSVFPKPRTSFSIFFFFFLSPLCLVPLHPSALSAQAEKPPPKYVIKLAALSPEGTSWADTGYQFKKYVEEKSLGQVQVIWYLGGIMGDEPDEFLKIRLGQLQGGGFTHLGLGIMVPETMILTLPFLFQSYEEIDYIVSELNPYFTQLFEKKGFILSGWLEAGLNYWFAPKKIESIQDCSTLKIWAWERNPIITESNKRLSFQNVPVTLPNVLAALERGYIDTFFGPIYAVLGLQWYTQAGYIVDPPFSYAPAAIVMDKKFIERLPPEFQKLIQDAWDLYLPPLVQTIREENRKAHQGFLSRGMKQITLDANTVQLFQDATRPIYDKFADNIYPSWLLEKTLTKLEEYRSRNQAP